MHRYTTSCALVALVSIAGCNAVDGHSSTTSAASTGRMGRLSTETFEAVELWDPINLFQGAFGGQGQPMNFPGGKLFCPGAPGAAPDQTGLCPAGTRIDIRDSVLDTFITEASDPAMLGWVIVDSSSSWDAEGTGPSGSKWTWYLGATTPAGDDADGIFQGTAEGKRVQGSVDGCTVDNPFYPEISALYPTPASGLDATKCWIQSFKLVGRGTSGIADGLQVRMTLTAYTYQLTPFAFIGSIDGTIFAP